jgi:hypothetical protein
MTALNTKSRTKSFSTDLRLMENWSTVKYGAFYIQIVDGDKTFMRELSKPLTAESIEAALSLGGAIVQYN